jgi:hypothetical protein
VGALLILVVIAQLRRAIMWQQRKSEVQLAQAARELVAQRARDKALQGYVDQISTLLLERDLCVSDKDSGVSMLARAGTVAVIQRMDSARSRKVTRFLNEAGLTRKGQSSIRILAGADLRGALLEDTDLSGANLLIFADQGDGDVRRTNVHGATGLTDEKITAA